MGRVVFLLLFINLSAAVVLDPSPTQWFNSTENYANRTVYFFIGKQEDGSVFLQVEPPPFYPSDQKFIDAGVAYIDAAKVLQTYTAEEVATLTEVPITFAVNAFANPALNQGYQFYGVIFQWGVNLDPKSVHFYKLQSVNTTAQYGIVQNLQQYRYNQSNGELTIYSDLDTYNTWLGFTNGAYLSPTFTYNYLFEKTEAADDETVYFTINVDFTQIAALATGTYTLTFKFQMNALSLSQPFATTIQNTSNTQVIQVNYIYNSIIGVDAYLDGNNTMYDPNPVDQEILRTNKTMLINKYNDTLDAMTIQWDGYAAMTGLSVSSRNLIKSMQSFITTAKANEANFSI